MSSLLDAPPDPVIDAFVHEVGDEGPVTCVGGRTQWEVGGPVALGTREVRAPAGIVAFEPAEMTVRVRAGTSMGELRAALAAGGQRVALPEVESATVGGLLAVGRSDHRRLGLGPVRNSLLELRYVSAEGLLVRAGGPTVKNVSGFDLCRLFVGSLGTLGLAAEVVLRTLPIPEASIWLSGVEADPFVVARRLHEPVAVLWDGVSTWVLLEGYHADVAAGAAIAAEHGLAEVESGPSLPPHRSSHDPAGAAAVVAEGHGRVVVEVGVGIAHREHPVAVRSAPAGVDRLHERVKAAFDPRGRLNPGRDPRRP